MVTETRQYDLVLLGATGYTGKLTAQYIQENVATDLKWAIAGRNTGKLNSVAEELKRINCDRLQPAIEIAEQSAKDLQALARKTKVLISTVGPYHKFGSPVVEACAKAGTHYLDVTGETPWVYDMEKAWHETAKQNGAALISLCGIESVPADILAYILVHEVRTKLNAGVTECINTLQDAKGGLSGGTLNTAISLFEHYSTSELLTSMKPYALSTVSPPSNPPKQSLMTSVLGACTIDGLGVLAKSPQAAVDISCVNRSWSLFDGGKFYGQNFHFTEWMKVSNTLIASLINYGFAAFVVSLYLPPVRWLLKKLVYEPGQGPDVLKSKDDHLVYKAMAKIEGDESKRAVATLRYDGPGYYFTGLLVVEAALVLLKGGETLATKLGGLVTPATLEQGYVERLQKAGVKIDVQILDKNSLQ